MPGDRGFRFSFRLGDSLAPMVCVKTERSVASVRRVTTARRTLPVSPSRRAVAEKLDPS